MINKNIIIAALARDCEDSLKNNIPLIEELRSQIRWSEVVVVENDSIDETKNLLSDWKDHYSGVTIMSKDFGTKTIPEKSDTIKNPMASHQRIAKMATYRNLYLDYIKEIEHPIDLLIVIDIDVMEIPLAGLINAINSVDDKTGAIFSNGQSVMKTRFGVSEIHYDTFAVWEYPMQRHFSYTPDSLARTFKTINKNVKKSAYYSVISAFGGVGVYNYQAIRNLRYEMVLNPSNKEEAICEHIPFNHEIIKRGFINYIARDFKVVYEKHGVISILKLLLPVRVFNFLYPVMMKIR